MQHTHRPHSMSTAVRVMHARHACVHHMQRMHCVQRMRARCMQRAHAMHPDHSMHTRRRARIGAVYAPCPQYASYATHNMAAHVCAACSVRAVRAVCPRRPCGAFRGGKCTVSALGSVSGNENGNKQFMPSCTLTLPFCLGVFASLFPFSSFLSLFPFFSHLFPNGGYRVFRLSKLALRPFVGFEPR